MNPLGWVFMLSERGWYLDDRIVSSRFVVKPEGGQKCIFDVFLTKPVGAMKTWGVERHQRGLIPNPPTNRALRLVRISRVKFVQLCEVRVKIRSK